MELCDPRSFCSSGGAAVYSYTGKLAHPPTAPHLVFGRCSHASQVTRGDLIRHDMNLTKVAAFVGHASISSTMRYVSISDAEASREAINTLMKLKC